MSDATDTQYISVTQLLYSGCSLAEILIRSHRKLFIFIIKKENFLDQSIQNIKKICNFEKGSTAATSRKDYWAAGHPVCRERCEKIADTYI